MNPLRLGAAIAAIVSTAVGRPLAVGDDIRLAIPNSWEQAITRQPVGLPTVAVKPTDDRDARLALTVFPASQKLADLVQVREMFRAGTQHMQPPNAEFAPTQFTIADGKGYWTTFEDPDLKGKPIQKGNTKLATVAFILMSNGEVLQATLLTNTKDSSEFQEGFEIIKSAKIVPASEQATRDATKSVVFRAPGLPGTVHFPIGYIETATSRLQSSNYFMVTHNNATSISGWIDEATHYSGFREFWKHEKQALVDHDMAPHKERVTKIGDWDAVVYLIDAGDVLKIKNLRACRVTGKVWVDVHISISRSDATWEELENALKSISVDAM
jgi:hypothetical protein